MAGEEVIEFPAGSVPATRRWIPTSEGTGAFMSHSTEFQSLAIVTADLTEPETMRILLADDDIRVGKHVRQALMAEGYAVDYAEDGDEALWLAENNPYDAIILDVMMPLLDGFTIARALRRKNIQTPVLFLTAKGEIEDRVRGLDVGGDDYMVKPFSVVELLARLRALLRRQRPQASNLLRFEDLELDLVSRQAKRVGKVIDLSHRNVSLMEVLMMTAPRPVSKAVIIQRVCNPFFSSQTTTRNFYFNTFRSHI